MRAVIFERGPHMADGLLPTCQCTIREWTLASEPQMTLGNVLTNQMVNWSTYRKHRPTPD